MQFNNPPGEIKNMTTLHLTKSIGRSSSRLALLLIPLVFACFALSPMAQAVSPPPDGGYPGGNTAEGFKALFNLSTEDGSFNTAVGFVFALFQHDRQFQHRCWRWSTWTSTPDTTTQPPVLQRSCSTPQAATPALGAGALLQNNMADGNTAVGALALQAWSPAQLTAATRPLGRWRSKA